MKESMKETMRETMSFLILALTEPQEDFGRSMRQMAGFLKGNGLDPVRGQTILVGKALPEPAYDLLPTPGGQFLQVEVWDPHIILAELERLCSPQLILFPPGPFHEELAVRLSARLGGSSAVNVVGLTRPEERSAGDEIAVRRSVYGGHLEGTFILSKSPFLITLDKTQEEGVTEGAAGSISDCERQDTGPLGGKPAGRDRIIRPAAKDSGLRDAAFVIAGGRGIGSGKGARELAELAQSLGAAMGGSRAAIMNAWIPRENLIGVSGESLHPQLVIACGVSGSPAFAAGIEKSDCIIAINTDDRAPIMKQADAAVCADWKEILTELARWIT